MSREISVTLDFLQSAKKDEAIFEEISVQRKKEISLLD